MTVKSGSSNKTGTKNRQVKKTSASKSGVKKDAVKVSAGVKGVNKSILNAPKRKKQSLIGVDPLAWIKDEEVNDDELKSANQESDEINDAGAEQVEESIRFSQNLNIQEVSGLYNRMNKMLEQEASIDMEMKDVEVVDAAGLQLILAFNNEAKARGISLRWHNVPDAVNRTLELMGMEDEIVLS